MYYDKKRDRVLLRDGRSVVSPTTFSRMVLRGEDVSSLRVLEGEESSAYDLIYGTSTSSDIEDITPIPQSHEHTKEQLDQVIDVLVDSDRWDASMVDRVDKEIDFFDRTDNITFLIHCIDLVKRMKEDGVVWGVGRGSSCGSLVMYLIGVNDINPLKYNIPFEEFSKEQDD